MIFPGAATVCALVFSWTVAASPAHAEFRQWRTIELQFYSSRMPPHPMEIELTALFTGPGDLQLKIPGFWDGENLWKVRFTPTDSGEWRYSTACSCSASEEWGLHDQSGSFLVLPAIDENPLRKHGGFLRVSPNRRYLTYSDGTPFFWLGDTWWFCPSSLCPIDSSSNSDYSSMFGRLLDIRKKQGFTVIQMAFLDHAANSLNSAVSPNRWNKDDVGYWRAAERYITEANESGILPVIGIGFHQDIDRASLDHLRQLWRYVIARYGAFAVTWLVVGEYNLYNVAHRVEKVLALGEFIKENDPYKRAMTVHPWYYKGDWRQAWNRSWYDFIMIQCGHEKDLPTVDLYLNSYDKPEPKPLVEAECQYEGIHGKTEERVRAAAYRAIQSGSFGYTYGAHGLWYPTQSAEDTKFHEWGEPVPWWRALLRPGGAQMQLLRQVYETVDWWKLEPRPNSVVTGEPLGEEQRILTKAKGDTTFMVYFPQGVKPTMSATLTGVDADGEYMATWFSLQRNLRIFDLRPLQHSDQGLRLPDRRDQDDWILIVAKVKQIPQPANPLLSSGSESHALDN